MIKLRKDNYRMAKGVPFDCFLIVCDHSCDLQIQATDTE